LYDIIRRFLIRGPALKIHTRNHALEALVQDNQDLHHAAQSYLRMTVLLEARTTPGFLYHVLRSHIDEPFVAEWRNSINTP